MSFRNNLHERIHRGDPNIFDKAFYIQWRLPSSEIQLEPCLDEKSTKTNHHIASPIGVFIRMKLIEVKFGRSKKLQWGKNVMMLELDQG